MKKGDLFEGIVDVIEFPNKGIVTVDGERIVVKNALPGQRIQGVLTKKRKGKSEGRLLTILEPSPVERPGEACEHFGICGGCVYQSLPYEEQLKIKESQVKALLDPVVKPGSYEFQGIKGSPISDGYRNKMEFSFGDEFKGGPLALGMHKRGSFYDIVTTPGCRIVHGDFCKILESTRAYFAELGTAFLGKLSHKGYLRHLLVRRAVKTGEILVDLVTTTQTEYLGTDMQEDQVLGGWKERLLGLELEGRFAGILHTLNDSLADVVQSDRTDVLWGEPMLEDRLCGNTFLLSPHAFYQVNHAQAERLYACAVDYAGLTGEETVLDLYCGAGTITLALAAHAKHAVGVEIVPEAIENAKNNARRNGAENVEFYCADAGQAAGRFSGIDVLVVDPPRKGLDETARDAILKMQPPRVVYVSCDPATLARDVAELCGAGYTLEKAQAYDLFPRTFHVETVALLTRTIR